MNKYEFPNLKNDSTVSDQVSRDTELQELKTLKEIDGIAFNEKAEVIFVKILCELIEEFDNRLYKRKAIAEVACILDISVVTSGRYIEKHTASRGKFEIKDKFIRCKECDQKRRFQIKVIKGKK